MAAATEDRLDVFVNEPSFTLMHGPKMADTSDVFYEATLAELNAAGDEASPLTHSAGDDDSGVAVVACLQHQEDDPFTGNVQRDRAGKDPRVDLHSGAIIEFEIADSIGNYGIGDDVYGVDNQTVNASQADGSSGDYAFVGRVYEVKSSTVKVFVPGILG